jgi:serine/threonine-protein kinase
VQKIGKFEILARLGEGAMGTVYRARDPVLDREVALKTVSASLLSRPEALLRFEREARAAARLQHPHIVTIYELGQVEGQPFIAMELCEGHDLAQVVAQRERFSLGQRLRMVVDVCRALDFAHKRGVIHRDIKPANVRVLRDSSVKLVDFGIARLADSKMTQTGLVLGTPSYVAPESLVDGTVDHRADMWSVGVVLFELLTGRCPFRADTVPALIYRIVREPLPPLDAGSLGTPPPVVEVIERALRKAPSERYRDLAEMAAALEEAAGISGGASKPQLGAAERARACEESLAEAQRLLGDNDLERALEAARRAQALEPSRVGVAALVRSIEERLEEAPTVTDAEAIPETIVIGPAPELSQVTSELVRRRGSSAFEDLGTFGEPPAVQAACLCPRGELLATAGADGATRIWNLRSRSRVATLRTQMHQRAGHDARILAVAYSPDGELLASGHVDGAVHLWHVGLAREYPVRLRHEAMVGAVSFSPDGSVLASGGTDANLKLWDVEAATHGEARRELLRQPSGVTAVAYAADGGFLVTGHTNRLLRVLDTATHRLAATLRGPEAQVCLLVAGADGRLVVGSHDRTLRLFDLNRRSEVGQITELRRPPTGVTYAGDEVLLVVTMENVVHLFDRRTAAPLGTLWGPSEESYVAVATFDVGRGIAATLADGRVRLWSHRE